MLVVLPEQEGKAMKDRNHDSQESPKDRLVARPEGKLPTTLDPAGPAAHGWPADPAPEPTDPADESAANEISRTA
jgi:hypothetical protein